MDGVERKMEKRDERRPFIERILGYRLTIASSRAVKKK